MTKKKMTTRRLNPARKCKVGSPIGKGRRRSLFDTLPEEAVDNVVRFTSSHPFRRDWASFVASRDAESLLSAGGILTSCSRALFRKLDVRPAPPSSPRGVVIVAAGHASRHHFSRMLAATGPHLRELRVQRDSFPSTWAAPLVAHCPNIRRLSLSMRHNRNRFPLAAILAPLSGKLESLEISWHCLLLSDVAAVARHCRGLRQLSIMVRDVLAPLEPVWAAVGPSLHELCIRGIEGAVNMGPRDFQCVALKRVGNLCRQLSRLTVECLPAAFHQELANLAVSYGAQLQGLELNWCKVRADQILQIKEACPAVAIDIKEGCGPSTDALVALGERARRINIGCDTVEWGDVATDNLVRVSRACANLESVTVWCENVPDYAFAGLFAAPKQQLREFRAKYVQQPLTVQILQTLADKATQLETFELSGTLPTMKMLRTFANKSERLVRVTLGDVLNPGMCTCIANKAQDEDAAANTVLDPDANFGTAVSIFARLPTVRELTFACARAGGHPHEGAVKEFERACFPARMKSVSVTICGCHYV